jgi:hypothetical protein
VVVSYADITESKTLPEQPNENVLIILAQGTGEIFSINLNNNNVNKIATRNSLISVVYAPFLKEFIITYDNNKIARYDPKKQVFNDITLDRNITKFGAIYSERNNAFASPAQKNDGIIFFDLNGNFISELSIQQPSRLDYIETLGVINKVSQNNSYTNTLIQYNTQNNSALIKNIPNFSDKTYGAVYNPKNGLLYYAAAGNIKVLSTLNFLVSVINTSCAFGGIDIDVENNVCVVTGKNGNINTVDTLNNVLLGITSLNNGAGIPVFSPFTKKFYVAEEGTDKVHEVDTSNPSSPAISQVFNLNTTLNATRAEKIISTVKTI